MAYTNDDYLKDCMLAKIGDRQVNIDAKHRKDLYELNHVELIYKHYPQYKDEEIYDDFVVFVNNKNYTAKDLKEWLNYSDGSELNILYKRRTSLLKMYKTWADKFIKSNFEDGRICTDMMFSYEDKIIAIEKEINSKK